MADDIWIEAKFHGKCKECGDTIYEGDRVLYNGKEQAVYCRPCGKDIENK